MWSLFFYLVEFGIFNPETILMISIASSLVILGILEMTLRYDINEVTNIKVSPMLKIASGVLLLICGLLFEFSSILTLIICSLTLIVHQVYGATVWFRDIDKAAK